jgi:hypothetical protein
VAGALGGAAGGGFVPFGSERGTGGAEGGGFVAGGTGRGAGGVDGGGCRRPRLSPEGGSNLSGTRRAGGNGGGVGEPGGLVAGGGFRGDVGRGWPLSKGPVRASRGVGCPRDGALGGVLAVGAAGAGASRVAGRSGLVGKGGGALPGAKAAAAVDGSFGRSSLAVRGCGAGRPGPAAAADGGGP